MSQNRILVVDDESIIRKMLSRVLKEQGFEVDSVENAEDALKKLDENKFDLVITDLKMPGIGGMELLKRCKQKDRSIEVIIITGFPTAETAVEAMKMGAADFICKPFDLDALLSAVEKSLIKKSFKREDVKDGELEILLKVAKIISSELNLEETMGEILNCAIKLTNTLCGHIVLFKEKDGFLEIVVTCGTNNPNQADQLVIDESIKKALIDLDQEHAIDSELEKKLFLQINKQLSCNEEMLNILLRSHILSGIGAGVFGVLSVCKKPNGQVITDRDRTMLKVLGSKLSIAFENRRLIDKINQINK